MPDQNLEGYELLKKPVDVFYKLTNTPNRDGYWRKVRILGWKFAKWKAHDFEDERLTLKIVGYDKRRKSHIVFIQTATGWKTKRGLSTKLQLAQPFKIGEYLDASEIPF